MVFFLITIFFALFSCNSENNRTELSTQNKKPSEKIFDKIVKEESGLVFNNALQEDLSSINNLFNYDYFYNGAGVGIADINNDGLQDIFFCGNQVNNKLFLNKGKLVFEEITNTAKINEGKTWSNGVTFVDINNDGWLDIYISQGGPKKRENRKNLLFINQQNGNFTEEAQNYGLDDMGISTQSVFFDFDKDGDLDCLVMNENEYYGVDPINLYKLIEDDKEAKYFNSSHLYINDNGKFKDVTKTSGIERPIFGLGLSVTDINDDGWLDIYIASDYYIPDALFINNQNGTFTDEIKEYTKQISFFGMGVDVSDINNDGLQDIFVLDMAANDHVRSKTLMASMNTDRFDYLTKDAGFQYQYMFNSLQLNNSNNKFTNISQATSMANTDWSWSILMSDYDHDTDKDVFITNGYRRYALDNDLQRKVYEAKLKYKGQVPLEIKKQLYESMPSEKLQNILFENEGSLQFSNQAKSWGLDDLTFSNGVAQGDLDNDGDLDLVVNNIDENCFLYKNLTIEQKLGNYIKVIANGQLSESFPKISIKYGQEQQYIETRRVRGYRSAQENIAHFGLGDYDKIDTIRVKWPSGRIQEKYNISSNNTIIFNEEDKENEVFDNSTYSTTIFEELSNTMLGIDYVHQENVYDDFEKEILLPYKQSTLGPFISKGDLNGDGLEDIYLGGASGQAGQLYLQNANGHFTKKTNNTFENDRYFEDMQSIFFDWDNDGDLDLFVVSGGNEFANHSSLYNDRLYVNDGNANFEKANLPSLQSNPKSGRSVDIIDFDNDGDNDILVGNRIIPQNYPIHATSTLWENVDGKLKDVTKARIPSFENFGIVNDILVTDFNGDGWQDFIAVGEWTSLGFYKNNQGEFSQIKLSEDIEDKKGWWFSVHETDINNDGLPDYILGNAGLNIKFKASQKKPFKVHSTDFDGNGTPDIVLSKKYKGEYVPVRGRECSSQQMPFIQEKFKTYSDFANANLIDIYGDKLSFAYEREVNEFHSTILINKGNTEFKSVYLPIEAQLFPILKVVFKDLNDDGFEDAIMAGNIYNTEVETPRLDAFSGTVLFSNGKDGYKSVANSKSGLLLDGNIKDLEFINQGRKTRLLTTQNNGPIKVHKMTDN